MSDVIIRPLDLERDAQGLADMWNASDLQWPGGWTDGLPFTVEDVRQMEEEERNLVVYVAEVDGEIAGYCSFDSGHHGPDDEGYLGLLNVHPKYQRRSIGRRLIQATIDRAVQEGWKRQTLGTWAANFKSVPTYKKTGHFWRPGTGAWMQDFVPGALQMPIARPFFERHNWYDSYVRALEQTEDDERWEGLKVYTMRWHAEGESLTIWIDREALAPTAVETDEVFLAAIPSELEPLNGSETAMHWRIGNKSTEPLHVHVRALGADGLEIDHHEFLAVAPGGTVEHVATIKVTDDAPRSKEHGVAPAVRTIFTLDHLDVDLSSGMRPRRPLQLSTDPEKISLRPGVPATVSLQVRNERDVPAMGSLFLTLPAGVTANWSRSEVVVPPRSSAGLPVTLTASREGTLPLVALWSSDNNDQKPVTETFDIMAIGPGGLVAHRQGKEIRIETGALRVTVQPKWGSAEVVWKETGRSLLNICETVGPPYWPSLFWKTEMGTALEWRDGRAVAHTWADAGPYKGLVYHRELTVSASGTVMARLLLENHGPLPHRRRCRLDVNVSERGSQRIAAPLRGGIVCEPTAIYPQTRRDLPLDPSEYDEPWLATEHEGLATGVAWGGGLGRLDAGWQYHLTSHEVTVEPGQRCDVMTLAFCVARGGWESVRAVARGWLGDEKVPLRTPPVRLAAQAQVLPRLVKTITDAAEAKLVIDSVSVRPRDGEASILLPAGLSAEPESIAVSAMARNRSVELPVRFALPPQRVGVWRGESRLDLGIMGGSRPITMARVGTAHPVSVHTEERDGQQVWVVDNGSHSLIIAPAFGPSVVSWTRRGVEQLQTFFPRPQGLSWFYPFFGGLWPIVMPAGDNDTPSHLHLEAFSGAPLDVTDEPGICWRGVRLTARPRREELRDLQIEADWLTLGESPVIRFTLRVHNLEAAARRLRLEAFFAFSLGADPHALVLHGEGLRRAPAAWQSFCEGARWGLLTTPQTGASVCVASAEPYVSLVDLGQHGRMLGLDRTAPLSAEGVLELTAYLALGDTPEQALQFRALGE